MNLSFVKKSNLKLAVLNLQSKYPLQKANIVDLPKDYNKTRFYKNKHLVQHGECFFNKGYKKGDIDCFPNSVFCSYWIRLSKEIYSSEKVVIDELKLEGYTEQIRVYATHLWISSREGHTHENRFTIDKTYHIRQAQECEICTLIHAVSYRNGLKGILIEKKVNTDPLKGVVKQVFIS